jgi:ATP-binding cassette subfamily F protein 3
LRHFPGGYQYYLDKTGQAARAALTSSGISSSVRNEAEPQLRPTNAVDRKEQRRIEAEQRQARSKKRKALQERIAGLEKEIAELEQQERDYAAELEKPETYHSGGRATQINRELMHVTERLEAANAEWEQAGTELSAFEAETSAA